MNIEAIKRLMQQKQRCLGLLLLFLATPLSASLVTRAAFDIGSSDTKMLVAQIDTQTGHIVEELDSSYKLVEYREDLAHDNSFSPEIVAEGCHVISDLVAKAKSLGATEFVGVATAAFREASNGTESAAHISDLRVIDQITEAQLGLESVNSLIDHDKVIMLDVGGGSTQMAAGDDIMLGQIGDRSLANELANLRGTASLASLNPISLEELDHRHNFIITHLPKPDWFDARIDQGYRVVTLAGNGSVYAHAVIATESTHFTALDLEEALANLAGCTTSDLDRFPDPEHALIELVFLHALMTSYNFDAVDAVVVNGSTRELLLQEEFWEINL